MYRGSKKDLTHKLKSSRTERKINVRLLTFAVLSSLGAAAFCQPAPVYPKSAALKKEFDTRSADWRNGAVVYQVFVDRYAPSRRLEAKKNLYAAPKTLHPWSEDPKPGSYLPDVGVWSHEIAFWGGDLESLRSKLGYIQDLGANVIYLNPIFDAFTNHKYDALDYMKISPEYGTDDDLKSLTTDLHHRGMKLMLDGVFNHQSRRSEMFQSALNDPHSKYRDWFLIGPQYKLGYSAWADVANIPNNNLESPAVRDYLWNGSNSVVQHYLKEGIDGWRLDVAYDIGFDNLNELTRAAHRAKPGSATIGEIWTYPELWSPAVDGIMNFNMRQLIFNLISGDVSPKRTENDLDRMVQDCGIPPLLKSWIVLDNHDTDRLKNMIPDEKQRRMAQFLQFTLPGSPCIYYGAELGMTGAGDPGSRGPMRWEMATDSNPELSWYRKLAGIHRKERALQVGDVRVLDSDKLLAFLRYTDHVRETLFVLANPGDESVSDSILCRDSRVANYGPVKDEIDGSTFSVKSGYLKVTVPAHSFRLLKPVTENLGSEYSPYKRFP